MPVNSQPAQVLDSTIATPADQYSPNSSPLTSSTLNLMSQPVRKFVNMNDFESTIIAVIDTRLSQNQRQKQHFNSQRFTRGAARGRNLRTTDGQPICNTCQSGIWGKKENTPYMPWMEEIGRQLKEKVHNVTEFRVTFENLEKEVRKRKGWTALGNLFL